MKAGLYNPAYGLTWRAALGLGSEGSLSPRRNKIINGEMRIAQQAPGGTTVNTPGPYRDACDKWIGVGTAAAGAFIIARTTATPPTGFTHYLRMTTTTADAAPAAASQYTIEQRIEGNLISELEFGLGPVNYVYLTFKARSSLTGMFSGSLRNGPLNRSLVFSFSITAANTWTDIAVRLPVDQAGVWNTDNTTGLILTLDMGSGANWKTLETGAFVAFNFTGVTGTVGLVQTNGATLDLTAVQLEAGTLPSAFERVPLDMEIRHCQREYFKTFNQATAVAQNVGINTGELIGISGRAGVSTFYVPLSFPVLMRATPTITAFNPAAANSQARDEDAGADCSGTSTANVSERCLLLIGNGNAGTIVGNRIAAHLTADARL